MIEGQQMRGVIMAEEEELAAAEMAEKRAGAGAGIDLMAEAEAVVEAVEDVATTVEEEPSGQVAMPSEGSEVEVEVTPEAPAEESEDDKE